MEGIIIEFNGRCFFPPKFARRKRGFFPLGCAIKRNARSMALQVAITSRTFRERYLTIRFLILERHCGENLKSGKFASFRSISGVRKKGKKKNDPVRSRPRNNIRPPLIRETNESQPRANFIIRKVGARLHVGGEFRLNPERIQEQFRGWHG